MDWLIRLLVYGFLGGFGTYGLIKLDNFIKNKTNHNTDQYTKQVQKAIIEPNMEQNTKNHSSQSPDTCCPSNFTTHPANSNTAIKDDLTKRELNRRSRSIESNRCDSDMV